MSFLERAKFLLRRHRIFPNRLLGQNFMVDPSIYESMINYASLSEKDVVLDVGAGLGFLTRLLADRCKEVLAVESDRALVKLLRGQLEDLPNVRIIEGDVLEADVPPFNKVVSIPPYHISSLLLLWLFHRNFDCGVLVFQKEFADRLIASVGGDGYGWLAVVAYYYVEVELLGDVPRLMFYPQPEVDSVVVRLKPKMPRPFALKSEAFFRRLARSLFVCRNRKVGNAVVSFIRGERATNAVGAVKTVEGLPFRDKRVRELAPEDFGVLSNVLFE